MSQVTQDIRYAFRSLRRNSPGFTTVSVLTLAVGIGANTAMFSFVDGVLLKPLPYANAGRIVRLLENPSGDPDARNGISTRNAMRISRAKIESRSPAMRFGSRSLARTSASSAGRSGSTVSVGVGGGRSGRELGARAPRGSSGSHRLPALRVSGR